MSRSDRFNNILLIKPGAIGDVLQMTPVIRALKSKFPQASVALLVGSSSTAELFKNNASVSETIVFDKTAGGSSGALLKLWQRLHRNKYDLVINFQRSNLKTWFLASAAFPCRLLIYRKTEAKNVHAIVNYLETLAPLGIESVDVNLEIALDEADRAFAVSILGALPKAGRPLIALNPGASHPVNRWGAERFAELADRLAGRLSAKVIIIGGSEDIGLAADIEAKTGSKPLVMTGRTTLRQLAALLERCDILVSGDTGPMHIAAAVGTRVIALFGAADPERTGPIGKGHRVLQADGVPCVPCRSRRCLKREYRECMEKISVSRVYETIRDMLAL